ncbi:MAG: lipopolysaccharide heptosyltransferase II [Planctomycetia bacterium]|nr:lipopolysaccharide heptosyltransferase II [Planctomycetia bacterium]
MLPKSNIPLADLEPRRILLIKPSALGDIVQTIPSLSLLRRRFPRAHIAWLVKAPLAGILRGQEDLDDVIELPYAKGRLARLAGFFRVVRKVRGEAFDLVIDMQGLFRSALVTWLSGAPRRLGMAAAREGAPWAYTDRVHVPWREIPGREVYLRIIEPLGCRGPLPATKLPVKGQDFLWASQRIAHLPRPLLAIHPGAQWETKCWPPESFAELAGRSMGETGAGVVLVGGSGDTERCQRIAARLDGPLVNLAGQTSLTQLAAVASLADVFLSGDTGPMHLAAAVETPVVALFTCTSPLRAGPRPRGGPSGSLDHAIVQTRVPCASSYLKRCGSLACMQELTPDRVWPALREKLVAAAQSRLKKAQ